MFKLVIRQSELSATRITVVGLGIQENVFCFDSELSATEMGTEGKRGKTVVGDTTAF